MSGSVVDQPDISVTLANAGRSVSNFNQKVLMIGQASGGTATLAQLLENVPVDQENALFGVGKMLTTMIKEFRRINRVTQIDAMPLADSGSTFSVKKITFVGTATAAGSYTIIVGSGSRHKYVVPVAIGDDETAIGVTLKALVDLDLNRPFNCTLAAGIATFTAIHAGAVYEDIGISYDNTLGIAGLTDPVVALVTTGATDPTLTAVLDDAIDRYQCIVWPYADVTVVKAYLDSRFNIDGAILDGIAVMHTTDSLSNCLAVGNAHNSESLVFFCDELVATTIHQGAAMMELPFSKISAFAAVRALRLTEGASVARYLTTPAASDQFGGTALASLPLFNTGIPEFSLPINPHGWTDTEIIQLNAAGMSIMGGNRTGTGVLLGEVLTTYKTDLGSNPDETFKYLSYVDTASNVREYFFNNMRKRFAQSRLTEGDVLSGRDMANPTIIKAFLSQLYGDLSAADFVLVQAGEVALDYFKRNLSVVLDLEAGKVTLVMFTPIVTQLRVIVTTIKVAFDTGV